MKIKKLYKQFKSWFNSEILYRKGQIKDFLHKYFLWPWQRVYRGFDDLAVWHFQSYHQKIVPRMLRELAHQAHGWPCGLDIWCPDWKTRFPFFIDNNNLNTTQEQFEMVFQYWKDVLVRLAYKFEYADKYPPLESHFEKYTNIDLDYLFKDNLTNEEKLMIDNRLKEYSELSRKKEKLYDEAFAEYVRLMPCLWD